MTMRTLKVSADLVPALLKRHPDAWLPLHAEHPTLILLIKLAHPTERPLRPISLARAARDVGITRQHAYRRLRSAGAKGLS